MHAARVRSVVLVAEAGGEEGSAQGLEGIGERDLLGRPGQHVAAASPAHALDEPALAQVAPQLSYIRNGEPFLFGDGADSERLGSPMTGQLEQAAEAVFLLGGDLHGSARSIRAVGSNHSSSMEAS